MDEEQQVLQELTQNRQRPTQEFSLKKEGLPQRLRPDRRIQIGLTRLHVRRVILVRQQVRKAELIPDQVVPEATVIRARA